jgi:hypothetical protein
MGAGVLRAFQLALLHFEKLFVNTGPDQGPALSIRRFNGGDMPMQEQAKERIPFSVSVWRVFVLVLPGIIASEIFKSRSKIAFSAGLFLGSIFVALFLHRLLGRRHCYS